MSHNFRAASPVVRRPLAAIPLALAALCLTGCFRTSGSGIVPTPAEILADSGGAIVSNPPQSGSDSQGMPAAPDAAVPEAADIVSDQPPATPEPAITLMVVTSTPSFITPMIPIGLVTPDTPAPTPEGGLVLEALPTSAGSQSSALSAGSPAPGNPPLITPTGFPEIEDECLYTVVRGDSLYSIALSYNTTVLAFRQANPDLTGDPPIIYPGDTLRVPDCGDTGIPPLPPAVEPAPVATTGPSTAAGQQVYTIVPGDTLSSIAQRFGVTIADLVEANDLPNPDSLRIGDELIIPGS
jgi:LysM repeat protein